MSEFDDAFAPLEPKNTARLTLYGVKCNGADDVVLIGKHVGPLNDKYQSESAKEAKKHAAGLAADDSPAKRALVGQIFARLISRTALTGWENVCSRDGKPIPFTPEQGENFLLALQKKRPKIAGSQGAIDRFFTNDDNFCDGYGGGDVEVLGEG